MKIAIIRKDFFTSWGGGERYAVNLSEGLANLGHDVHVFAHRWGKNVHPDITFHHVPAITLFSSLKNLSFAHMCRKLLSRQRFDITQSLSQTYPQDVYRMGDGIHRHWLRIQSSHPLYRWCKTLTLRQQVILYLEKQTFSPANYRMIICNSHLCRRQASQYFKVPEEKISVIYNGVDHAAFHPGLRRKHNLALRQKLRIAENAVVILFVAGNFRRKGLWYLIDALPFLREKREDIKLVVVGRGNSSRYRRRADQLGVGERLLFSGETDTIAHFYGMGDLLVLPTAYDPFSNVCLEALACGIPAITTSENGAAEIIKPGETGVVVSDPSNSKEFAEGISLFLPAERREAVRMKAVESVRPFTIEGNTRRTLEVYHQVISMKRRMVRK